MSYPPVVIERELDAPIERVYRAWTDPALLQRWFRGTQDTVVESAEVDLKVDGKYRIAIRASDGEMFIVFGEYTELKSPTAIEFTWLWEEAVMEPGETLVRVDLRPEGEKRTHLTLTHSRFTNERSSQAHDKGWLGVLATLASFVSEDQL